MGDKTSIAWTDATWNPWMGCTKVSAGCKNCYMFRQMQQYGRDPQTVVRSKTKFDAPLKWKEPRMIFTCSWSDFFHEAADDWRADAWDVIRRTPQHTYQILIKRSARIAECLPEDWGGGYPNVWLGVSTELGHMAEARIPNLLTIRAKVRFISAEPLLGPIQLEPQWLSGRYSPSILRDRWRGKLDWVIVGGESGSNFRPMDMAWARSLRDQCVSAGVPFFFKQDSDARPGQRPYIVELDGSHTTWQQFPSTEMRKTEAAQQTLPGME